MSAKRSSPSDKAQHLTYKTQKRWGTNRLIKLTRALKKNPENKQIEVAMKNISYRRGTPTTTQWSHSDKKMAQMVKTFCGFCDKNIFSSNKDAKHSAFLNIASKRTNTESSLSNSTKGMFSLKTRAHNGGALVWA